MKRLTTIAASGFLALSLALSSLPGVACGPFFNVAVFNYPLHPGLPLASFSEGSLGVIRPTFARSYLVVAYRYLSGVPLSKEEQAEALSLWRSRLIYSHYGDINTAVEKWKKARARVTEKKVDIEPYGSGNDYYQYLRVTSNSFETAVDSLDKMIARFGIKSKAVTDWLTAQDIVFGEGKDGPVALPDDAPEYLKNERQYQIASFYFYRKSFDEAIEAFEKIADNKNSRWSKIAPYIVARAYIRKSQLGVVGKKVDTAALFEKAKKQLESILSDDSQSSLHTMSKKLIQYVAVRNEPLEALNNMSDRVATGKSPQTFRRDLTDMIKVFDDIYIEQNPEDEKKEKPQPPRFQSDLAEWVWTINSNKKENLDKAIAKWRTTKSLPWLICSLALASKKDSNLNSKDLSDLISASEAVETKSPGYYSTAYYTAKILNNRGEIERASKITDAVLSNQSKLSRTTVNLFKNLKVKQVNDLNQFISLIPRTIAGDDFVNQFDIPEWFFTNKVSKEKKPGKISIEPVTATLINTGLPIDSLIKIVDSNTIPAEVQKNITPAIWVRAVLLNREKEAIKISYKVENLIPELKSEMVAYRAAKNPRQRKFLAIYTALRNPGLRPYVSSGYARDEKVNSIDSYRDNWWGKGKVVMHYGPDIEIDSDTIAKIARRMLNAREIETAEKEYNQLVNLGTAPNYLASEIIAYAKVYPNDSRVPEALHRAVKATRYGSTDNDTTQFSKACFKLLHNRYKNSTWTKQTPYYY